MSLFPKTCPACGQPSVLYDITGATCTSCSVYTKKLNYLQHAVLWARAHGTGFDWTFRLVVLAGLGYIFFRGMSDPNLTGMRGNPVSAFDLGIHELGHFLFIPLGEFMTIAGGSLFQCLFPLLWLGACIWKRWHFAASMMLVWFAYNLFDVAMYAADARARLLPLATFSDDYDSAHDWYQILSRLDKLQYDTAIAHGLKVAGIVCGLAGLVSGFALVCIMFGKWFGRIGAKPEAPSV